MKKLIFIFAVFSATIFGAAGNPQFGVNYNPLNNNMVFPTNITFSGPTISNALLVTNLTEFILWSATNGASSVSSKLPTVSSAATNLISYGATVGGNVDVAMATFVASTTRTLVISQGTYVLTNNFTLPAGYYIRFENGGMLSISSGKVLTINGGISAENYQIFTGSGTATFTTTSPNGFINVLWYGALDSNTRTDDSLSAFNKAIAAAPSPAASRGMYIYVPSGNYNFSAGITVPISLDIRGDSPETTIIRANLAGSGTLLALPANTEARFQNIQILNDTIIPSSMVTGISIGNDSSDLAKLQLFNVSIKQFTKHALSVTNLAYGRFYNVNFQDNRNSAALSGDGGTNVSTAFYVGGTNVLGIGNAYANAIWFLQCRFTANDQAIYNPAGVVMTLVENTFERNGERLLFTAPSTLDIGAVSVRGFELSGGYFEANYTGTNEGLIKLSNVTGAAISGSSFIDSLLSIERSYNSIVVAGQSKGVVVSGNVFDGTKGTFITNSGAASVMALGNTFATVTIGTNAVNYLTNYAQLSPFMSSRVIFDTETDGWYGITSLSILDDLIAAGTVSGANGDFTDLNASGLFTVGNAIDANGNTGLFEATTITATGTVSGNAVNATTGTFTDVHINDDFILGNITGNATTGAFSSPVGTFGRLNVTTNLTFTSGALVTNFPTGLGVTNIAGVISNNIIAGTNILISAGSHGQLTINNSGTSGGAGTVGTMISSGGSFVAGTVPKSSDTTGTNFITSALTITGTNATLTGGLAIDNLIATNGIVIGGGGTNLSITGNVLANGGVFTNTLTLNGSSVLVSGQGGNMNSSGASWSTGVIPKASGTTGTNFIASTVLSDTGTDVLSTGGFLANGGDFTANTSGNFVVSTRIKLGAASSSTATFTDSGGTQVPSLQHGIPVVAKTANYTVTALDSGKNIVNTGTTVIVTNTLPAASTGTGLIYTFTVTDVDGIAITAQSGEFIRRGSTLSASGGTISATTIGSSITLVAAETGTWTATAMTGDFNTASSGGGTTGTMINTTATVAGGLPYASDTTGTNFTAESAIYYNSTTNLLTITNSPGANTVSTGGIELRNDEVASSGNQMYSPALFFQGQGWKTAATAASQPVRFQAYVIPTQGASTPTANWILNSSINYGAFGNSLIYSSGGALTLGASVGFSGTSKMSSSANGAMEFSNSAGTARSTAQFNIPTLSKTANYTVVALDSGYAMDNAGAAGTVTNTLPTAAIGMQFSGTVLENQIFSLKPQATDRIINGATIGTAGGDIYSTTTNSFVRFYSPKVGLWVVTAQTGTWLQN